ncbi:hypothetical protein B0H63DRAFT_541355 [Podospora didyma]|uniref:G domain-containing protein n=1 Tax=Podospora didyma TaxID=330526 RepID=A0AAE0U147_9PEZI|nr:hypothetical protein B0H63DRAFT_541355 [Podospora didyma]
MSFNPLACVIVGTWFGQLGCHAKQDSILDGVGSNRPLIIAFRKSTFINSVIGQERLKIGQDIKSCTQTVDMVDIKVEDCVIRLIDTPGFDDTNLTNAEVLERIVVELGIQYKTKTKFADILYLKDITEYKMKGPDVKNLQMFRALCGTDGLEGVTLVTTKWNTMKEDNMAVAERREKEMLSEHFDTMMELGATYARDYGTAGSARRIIRDVLQKRKESHLPFQWEIMDQGKTLEEIDAGCILMKELHDERAKHRKELQELQESLITEHDEKLRKKMEYEAVKLEKRLRNWEEDRQRLLNNQAEQMDKMEKMAEKKLEQLRKQNEETIRRLGKEKTEELEKQQKIIDETLKKKKEGDSS